MAVQVTNCSGDVGTGHVRKVQKLADKSGERKRLDVMRRVEKVG